MSNPWLGHANPSLSQIHPYQPGKPESEFIRETGISANAILKLNSNESLWGPSPKVQKIYHNCPPPLEYYPDGNGFELKKTLSQLHHIAPEYITLGNGSNDVLELIARAFLRSGTHAIYSQHAFIVYHLSILTQQATPIKVPAQSYGHDLIAMEKAITKDTKIIFIANPNNPTGTFIPYDTIYSFIQSVPKHILIVLDEAYYDYLPAPQQANAIHQIEQHPNLILTRTLSKIYGLAALRIGYAISHPDLADLFNRVRAPFNTNSIAQSCAIAALQDQDYIQTVAKQTDIEKKWLAQQLAHLKVRFIPSQGNFICAEFDHCQTVYDKLTQQGILVRPIGGYEMPHHLRISVGQRHHNQRFIQTLSPLL